MQYGNLHPQTFISIIDFYITSAARGKRFITVYSYKVPDSLAMSVPIMSLSLPYYFPKFSRTGRSYSTPKSLYSSCLFFAPRLFFFCTRHLVPKVLLLMGTSFQLTTGNNLISYCFITTHCGCSSLFGNACQSSLPSVQFDGAQGRFHTFWL